MIAHDDAKEEVLELRFKRIPLNETLKQRRLSIDWKISLLDEKEAFIQKIVDDAMIRDASEEDCKQVKNIQWVQESREWNY